MSLFCSDSTDSIPDRQIRKKRVLEFIKKNLKDYNTHQISIGQCLYKTGGLTADLIVFDNMDVYIPQKIYDAVSEMAANYYAMLYVVDIHTSYYELNKKTSTMRV